MTMRGVWLLLILLLFVQAASASVVSVMTNQDVFENYTQVCASLTGDEPVKNVSIMLNTNGKIGFSKPVGALYPGQDFCNNFTNPEFGEGSFPIYSYVYYSDINDYPFSNTAVSRYGDSVDKLEVSMGDLKILGKGTIVVSIKNNADHAINAKVTILGPRGAAIPTAQGFADIPAGQVINVMARIENTRILPGNSCTLYVVVEYDDEVHHTVFAESILKIRKPFGLFKQKYFWLALAGAVLVAYALAYLFKRKRQFQLISDIFILALILIFILTYFTPDLIFSKTITAGGDMASHYAAADYFVKHIFPKPTAWYPGAYAGMPLFQFYFPAPFYIIALLAPILSLQIAFKLVTILGVILLPGCMYFSLKLMKFKFPMPAIGAILTLPFLFMESNSMWGGNIPSVLAGEFTYSIALALLVLYIGLLYKSVNESRHIIPAALLLALIGISHIYCLLIAVAASFFFLLSKKDFTKSLLSIGAINGLAFLLISFWLFPLASKLSFTTSYVDSWPLDSLLAVFSLEILPTLVLAIICAAIIFIFRKREFEDSLFYSFYIIGASIVLYFFAVNLHVIDIRFLPFVQLLVAIPAAYTLYLLSLRLKSRDILSAFLLFIVLFWVVSGVTFIPDWIKWNYSGFESKPTWSKFNEINSNLSGSLSEPRVVYEHTGANDAFGTVRAFELLPYFANRSTLEGLYFQSSPSAPFVFYLQSLVGVEQSCPFTNYACAELNYSRALPRLKMFNVGQVIVATDEAKKDADSVKDFVVEKTIQDYSIYKIENITGNYVEPLDVKPVIFETKKRALLGYLWFINDTRIKTPVVFTEKIKDEDRKYFDQTASSLDSLPIIQFGEPCNVSENVSDEKIQIKTDCIGRPLLVKFSYSPNWKVQGAKKIYYTAPSLMLVFPEQEDVLLYYSRTFFDIFGIVASAWGVICAVLFFIFRKKIDFGRLSKKLSMISKYRIALFVVLILLLVAFAAYGSMLNPSKLEDARLRMEIGSETGKFGICKYTGPYKDECLIRIAVQTSDENLCTVEVSEKNKEFCYEKVN